MRTNVSASYTLLLILAFILLLQINCNSAQYGVPENDTDNSLQGQTKHSEHENQIKTGSGIKFLLYYNPNDTESCQVLEAGNKESLTTSAYNSSRPIKLLVHGALANSQTPDDIKVVKDAYVRNCIEANVIMVDYGHLTKSQLPTFLAPINIFQRIVSMLRTNQIAQEIAEFVTFLIKCQVLAGAKDVHIIGFGLGAHIGGTVGRVIRRNVGQNVGRVSGLDPVVTAKLPFSPFRLDPSDADFVDVTNTALRKFTFHRRGHVRFYINGGAHQPNCPRIFTSSTGCSHHTAIIAFAKSIYKPKQIVGCRCLSIFCRSRFLNSKSCVDPITYGEYASKTSLGSYYVTLE